MTNSVTTDDILKMPKIKLSNQCKSKVGKAARVGIYRVAEGAYKPERKVHETRKISDIL